MNSIKAWCDSKIETSLELYQDIGVSGGVPIAERPQGARMLARVQPDDVIVVLKLDRLFRSVADAGATINSWCESGVKLVSLAEGIDLTNPYSRAMAHIMSAMAELERSMIRERTKAALQAKKRRGEIVGVAPYGWSNVPGTGQVLVNHKEQEVIQIIASCRAAGMKQRLIVAKLNGMGIKTRHGSGWRQNLISEILTRHAGSARQVMVS